MALKIIILDFDGTLANTQTLITNTMIEVIRLLNLESRTPEQCAKMIGLPLKETFTKLIPMSEEMGNQCVEIYNRVFNENNVSGAVPLFPHVLETLQQLHQEGYVLTIASSRSRPSLLNFINTFNLQNMISFVVSANDVLHAKPHAEPILTTLKHFGFQAKEALMVGDTVYDIQMGINANTHTCGVTYGNGTKEELNNLHTEYIIHDFSELLQVVTCLQK